VRHQVLKSARSTRPTHGRRTHPPTHQRRYDIAGLLRFLLLRRYDATVWYKPAPLYPDAGDAAAGACVAGSSAHGRVGDGAAPHPPRTLLPPAAVAPLPYHHQPALHAKLAPPAAAPADAAAHLQQQQGAAAAAPCCDSGGSSSSSGGGAAPGGADASRGSNDSGSRRSSLDGCSGPLPAAGAPKQQHSRDSKSVSFSPAPPVAAVHVSAASFSSRGSASAGLAGGAGSGGGASGVGGGGGTGGALGRTSRASSVTSERSSSRCHARCSRCSAASLHHSSSRQSFAHIHSLLAAGGAAEDGPTHSSSPPPSSDSNALLPPPSLGSGGAAAGLPAPGAAAGAAPAPPCPPGPGWLRVEGGAFASIMCVVTSCISDKSRRGLMPEAHLADGRLALVLVQGCGRLQYLRFLLRLARRGIVADGGSDGGGGGSSSSGLPPFVKVVYATEVQVVQGSGSSSSDGGGSSCWNVDGELLRHGAVRVGIHAGLVDVFARGVELM
jgi:ceramide kinase